MSLADQLTKFSGPVYTEYDEESGTGLERRFAPTAAELRQGETAPAIEATYPEGVIYFADHETLDDGLARQARLHARALHDAGVAVRLQTISNRVRVKGQWFFPAGSDLLDEGVLEEIGELRRATIKKPVMFVRHVVLTDAASLRHICLPSYLREDPSACDRVLAHTVLYAPFESDRLSPELADVVGRMGQVWLQCARNIDVFEQAGVPSRAIRCVPNAYDPGSLVAGLAVRRPTPPGGKRLLNIGKWEPRKGQHELFGAFMLGFGPKDEATLLVKTSGFGDWTDYPRDAGASIAYWLRTPAVQQRGWTAENFSSRIRVELGTMTEEQICRLYEVSNVYVSASHGEGWDYPAFDAMLAGNALVHVGFGGSEDYAAGTRVPYRLGPVHPGYVKTFGWHKDARWAEYELKDLTRALQSVVPPLRREPSPWLSNYSAQGAGKRMRLYLHELSQELELELPMRSA